MKKFVGVGVSNGLSCGNILKIEVPNFEIKDTLIDSDQVESSLNEYHNAVDKTISQLNETYNLVLEKIGKNEAKVFQSHIEILKDPSLTNEVISLIKDKRLNCASAVKKVFTKTVIFFSKMDNSYLNERASDIEDVMNNLLSVLLNKPLPNLLNINSPSVVAVHDLKPSQASMLNAKYVKGVITGSGGKTSHAAFIVQAASIPSVFGINNLLSTVQEGEFVVVNGKLGEVYSELNKNEVSKFISRISEYEKYKNDLNKYASMTEISTLDKHEVYIAANIGALNDMNEINKVGINSVGLFRTEFLYINSADWPTEDEQFDVYKSVLIKAKNNPVVIRTLDIGGDKILSYFKFDKEENPFLGFRAIRFCLANENIFRIQLRALIRASAFGTLQIMFPMITTLNELLNAKSIFDEEYQKLVRQNFRIAKNIKLGMMIEVPAAAILADEFAKHVDFFSIGTNDLIQYTLACDRTLKKVSYLYQNNNPAVLRLIKFVIDSSHKHKIWTGVCGQMASDPLLIPVLLGMGLDEFSMSINTVLENKKIISSLKYDECFKLAKKVIKLVNSSDVQKVICNFMNKKKLIRNE